MMLYAILVTQILISQPVSSENSARKLSLSQELFPNAELVWSREFEGKMLDFTVAKKSGHVVIGAVNDLKGWVYLFFPNGELLWVKESVKHSEIKKCSGIKVSISDSAETIGILWWGDYETEEEQVYNNSGEKLYSCKHGMGGPGIEISPGGGYMEATRLMDKTGKEILLREILKDIPIEKLRYKSKRPHIIRKADGTYSQEYIQRYKKIHNFEFISESEIAVFLDNVVYFYSFPEGELKWGEEVESGDAKITPMEKYILLSSVLSSDRKVYCFSKDGNLIWQKELENKLYDHIVSSSPNEKYVAIYGLPGKGRILVLDIGTGETKILTPELKSQLSKDDNKFLCLDDRVFLSGYASASSDLHKGYWTYILHFDKNWNIIDELWEKGLVLGNSDSPVIGVYESDATGRTRSGYNEGVIGFENSTVFTIDILKLKD